MSLTFNADEVFEMAIEIERNGAKFYRQAAEKAADADTKKFMLDMAVMEDGHEDIFKDMRGKLTADAKLPVTYDPDNQAAMYLQTMADGKGYEGKISLDIPLSGDESMEEIINIAIGAERNSVVFYVGLKSLIKTETSRAQVDKIIAEEMGHIAILQQKLLAM